MTGQRNSYGKRSHSQSDYGTGMNKRRNSGDDRDRLVIDSKDTVYRYLCPNKKIGSIIGRGGEIVKQLRIDTRSKIRIDESVPGCEERVVTIYSSSDESNAYEDSDDLISPAQDALFRVHGKVVADNGNDDEESEGVHQVTARLLVPSDQIGCIIGKGGEIVQKVRTESGAQIRILKDEHLPTCALSSDELVQIAGEAAVVKKALYQIAFRLHRNPSRSQHLLASAVPSAYQSSSSLIGPTAVCPSGNIGGVIGKGGTIINQIRQDSGAVIKVNSSTSDVDDCLITISAKEIFDDQYSATIEAALRLQPRCSEKVERDSGLISYTTRLLVPTSRIGCLLGKGGAIINEMRKVTKANIRILGKDNLPKVAAQDDEMVQISGDLNVAKAALLQVSQQLRANVFDREGAVSTFLPVLPYLPVPSHGSDGLNYDSRDSKRPGHGHSYSGSYGSSAYAVADAYGSYDSSQVGGSGNVYGAYGSYSSGRDIQSSPYFTTQELLEYLVMVRCRTFSSVSLKAAGSWSVKMVSVQCTRPMADRYRIYVLNEIQEMQFVVVNG